MFLLIVQSQKGSDPEISHYEILKELEEELKSCEEGDLVDVYEYNSHHKVVIEQLVKTQWVSIPIAEDLMKEEE